MSNHFISSPDYIGSLIYSGYSFDHSLFKIHKNKICDKDVALYTNGNKEYDHNYKDGKKDGLCSGWYYVGDKWYEKNYKDGELC